ncbi:RPL15 [Symbiodinium natans]|uniref:RPL15 protein n=1 Tax=Symbiodinium natans TaxID=878477 RepID=A0A812HDU4_9DINO|nr:RPL15 [Symbiodinium natans]
MWTSAEEVGGRVREPMCVEQWGHTSRRCQRRKPSPGRHKGERGRPVGRGAGVGKRSQFILPKVAIKLLRASPGNAIYADAAGRTVPVFRNVYAADRSQREDAYNKLTATYRDLERQGFGVVRRRPGAWPVFVKHRWSAMSQDVQATLRTWGIPLHFFDGFLEAAAVDLAAKTGVQSTQHMPGSERRQMAAESKVHAAGAPVEEELTSNKAAAEALASSEPQSTDGKAWRNIYNEVHEDLPHDVRAATCLARRVCQAAKPPCQITFGTKHMVDEGGCGGFKLWGSCAECRPKCSFRARVTVWVSGPAEGKVTVDCRGAHGKRSLATGGRLLSAGVAHTVNQIVEAREPITSRNIREALARKELELGCESKQLHNLVKRLRQKHGTASAVAPLPIQPFKDEAVRRQEEVSSNLQSPDLAHVFVLKSPHGIVVQEDRVYVPVTCPGMLLRLRDAARHRIRLIVDMKMGAVANNYGVVTLCFAASNPAPANTSATTISGRRQQYMAHTCTAQPVMQAIVNSEGEENLVACFEDLVWLCQEAAGFDLQRNIVQVQADFAPGIAAARRKVFPAARFLGDYFHYKKAVRKSLPSKDRVGQQGAKKRGRKKRDSNLSNVYDLSDLTRCLPTLQLTDLIWRAIFQDLPADAAAYLQRQFFQKCAVADVQRVFKTIVALPQHGGKLWLPSFWAGVFGTCPGSGAGSNPLEARHAAWEAELKSRTRSSLLATFDGLQHLYAKWRKTFEWGTAMRMSAFPVGESEHLMNSATLRSQGRSPAVDYWKMRNEGNHVKFRVCNSAMHQGP